MSLNLLLESLAQGGVTRRTAVARGVLVGVTGDGKSSTGNALTGHAAFQVSGGLKSETRAHAFADYRQNGAFWRVIDTAGLEDTCLPHLEVLRRFSLFADNAAEGVDSFVFVVRWGRFKPEHDEALECFAANVGEGALRRTVLCFTHCPLAPDALANVLADEGQAPASLQRWLPRLAAVVGVDHAAAGSDTGARLQGAMQAVVDAHGGERYSNAALLDAKARLSRDAEAERAAFAAAVSDWRKTEGPLTVEREPGVVTRPPQAL